MAQPQPPLRRPVPGAPRHVWQVKQVGGTYAFRVGTALLVAGMGAFVLHAGAASGSWLLCGVGLVLVLGIFLDAWRFRSDRLLEIARGYLLQIDLEGIRFLDLALLRWPAVRSLALEDLPYGKGRITFLAVELERAEFDFVKGSVSVSRLNHREIDLDVNRSTIALNLRSLEDEPSFILDTCRRFLSAHTAKART